jgi:hypothetical protein
MAKGKLGEPVKTLIVQSLVCFDTPAVVVDAVKREHGAALTR